MNNIDDILSVPGIEAIYVGPNDLSISLGIKPNTTDPVLDEAMREIVAGCRRNGSCSRGFTLPRALCDKRMDQGFAMVTVVARMSSPYASRCGRGSGHCPRHGGPRRSPAPTDHTRTRQTGLRQPAGAWLERDERTGGYPSLPRLGCPPARTDRRHHHGVEIWPGEGRASKACCTGSSTRRSSFPVGVMRTTDQPYTHATQ